MLQLAELNDKLSAWQLPTVDDLQLARLDDIGLAAAFSDLVAQISEDPQSRLAVELYLRSLSQNTQDTLEELGLVYQLKQMIAIAQGEGRRVFAALHAIRSKGSDQAESEAYIRRLGFAKVRARAAVASQAEPVTKEHADQRQPPPYYSFTIYARAAALCISEAMTRRDNRYTIQIEGANANPTNANQKLTFNWDRKVIIQLQVTECYQLLALLKGYIDEVDFKGHGRTHSKALHIERQPGHFYAKIIHLGRNPIGVQVTPVDAIPLSALLYRQIKRNEPDLSTSDINDLLMQMAREVTAKA